VPARNEAENLEATLAALYHQTDNRGNALSKDIFEVLLLVNNCTDDSAEVARKFQESHPEFHLYIDEISLPKNLANIGTIRRLLMDEACHRLKLSGNANGIIASTDGDTVVDSKWIYHIMQEIKNGADAVGGRILTHSSKDPVRLWHLRDVMYRSLLAKVEALIDPCEHDPWPRHFQYFGANLAVTCNAYEQAGRLPEVPFLEDSAFFQALNCIDARIRKSCRVKVYTSDRQQGRVEVGFSEQLKKWNEQKQQCRPQMVESVQAELMKYECRKLLRLSWKYYHQYGRLNKPTILKVARLLSISADWLFTQIIGVDYFGKLWQQVEADLSLKWNHQWKPLPISEAITYLRKEVNRYH
jgi:glycosyltransferase involved in cell wall biosynthesis